MARPRIHDQHTEDRLMEAAGRLLASEGPGALSVRRVADEVGSSTRAIYSVFGSKEGLVRSMYRRGFEALDRHLKIEETGDPRRDICTLALQYRASAVARPHLYDIMFNCPIPEFEPSEKDQEVALGTLAKLRRVAERGVNEGVFSGPDVEALTLQLWALAHGLASLELRGALGPSEGAEKHWRDSFEAITRGYAAPAGRNKCS